jgi:protein ImuA
MHEIQTVAGDGAGAAFAALLAGARSGPVLWCRSRLASGEAGDLYGLGLAALGLSSERLILVDAPRPADLLWAMEEGARTGGLAAVVGEGASPDLTAGRRLQLAAEAGRGLVLVLPSHPQSAGLPLDGQPELRPSVALTRWLVRSEASLPDAGGPGRPCWNVELRRCRNGGRPQAWTVEWDESLLSLSLVAPLPDRRLVALG